MAESEAELRRHSKLFLMVGALLLIGTVLTVLASRFDLGAPGLTLPDIFIGMLIATIKASAVALIFMHVKWEKRFVYVVLTFTIIFFIGLFSLIYFNHLDKIIARF